MNKRSFLTLALLCLLLPGTALAQGFWPQKVAFTDNWADPGFSIISNSEQGVELLYTVPYVIFNDMMISGEKMTSVGLPGSKLGNDEGAPNLPGMGRYIAVPQGASYSVEIVASRSQIFTEMDILPAPPIPYEGDDTPPVYVKNPDIYGVNASFPAQPVLASEPMQMRGVDCFILGITPFAYNPVMRELVIYTDIRVRIDFQGGSGRFGDDAYRSRWFEPILEQHLLNYTSLPAVDFAARPKPFEATDECEYMIFIPNDTTFETWANTIKDFRVKQGISTGVFNIANLGGTAAGIEAKINDAYANWTTKPVALLFLGDYPTMPAHTWNGYCLSDNMYADINGDDLPELAHGRITAHDAGDLAIMVNKFIDYESNPPMAANFYDEPIIAGGWQTERWFILACEVVHGYFTNVLGKSPVREYALYSGTPGSTWSSNQNTYMIVDYFGPNGLGYIPSTPAHLTDWGGNATRLNNDINSGAFWLLHRDHGSPTGWGEPSYSVSNLSGLTNTDHTYVLSINCSTGQYNYGSDCFAEAFHRMQYGALGVIAASGTSYSFVNDTYVWGMHDSLWSDFDPGYGGSTGPYPLLPGFANASGKHYLQASSWPYNPSNKDETYHLFHVFGDAFGLVYSEVPQTMSVSHASSIDNTATSFDVSAPAGSLIALSTAGRVLGTATGTGGVTTVLITPPQNPGIMYVTVTKPNYKRYEGQVVIQTGGPLAMWPPYGTPSSTLPGPEVEVEVMIVDGLETYVPGTGKVHYRFSPTANFSESLLTGLGGDLYLATIPGARPDSQPEFYFSAQGDQGSMVYSPGNAPQSTYTYTLEGLPEVIVHDDFEADMGWTVEDISITTGTWERCDPNSTSGEQVAPLDDNPQGTGTLCYVTENGPVNAYYADHDIDGGPTRLISPAIDLSSGDAIISAYLWFYGRDGNDPFNIDISNNNGTTWINVYSSTTSLGGWTYYSFKVADYVTPTAQIKVRFCAQDNPNDSITEAGVDDFMVSRINMTPSIWAGAYTISAALGCSMPLYLDAEAAYAGRQYIVGGSVSGGYPGYTLPGGKVIPLNYDWFTTIVLNNINSPRFQNFSGTLDSAGEAVATLDSMGAVNPLFVGKTLTFAFTLTGTFDFVSSPVQIAIEP